MPVKRRSNPRDASMIAFAARAQTLIRWLVAAALLLMMLLTFFDVIGRYVINRPFPGATEFVQYLMVAAIFLALPVVTYANEHINISLVESMLGPRARKVQRIAVWMGSGLVLGLLSVRFWIHGTMLAANRDVIGFLNLPVAPAAFIASVACGATALLLAVMVVLAWVAPVADRAQPAGQSGETVV